MSQNLSSVKISLASRSDFSDILELQRRNFLNNISPEDKADGFLSIEFTESMLEEILNDLLIIKAFTVEKLVGYRMAQTLEFNQRFPLIASIIEKFPNLEFRGQKLSNLRTFIFGPICIDKDWRGKGINQLMFKFMLEHVKSRYDVGVTFVSESNPRSLAAAKKNGISLIDTICFEEKIFKILAFSIMQSDLKCS